jgi:hypothetical protein
MHIQLLMLFFIDNDAHTDSPAQQHAKKKQKNNNSEYIMFSPCLPRRGSAPCINKVYEKVYTSWWHTPYKLSKKTQNY